MGSPNGRNEESAEGNVQTGGDKGYTETKCHSASRGGKETSTQTKQK